MLPSFYIENFRLFDQLTIKRLGRVNLIVGRNNAGKSAFLEAIFLFVSKAPRSVIYELIKSRQENQALLGFPNSNRLSLNPIRHLFKGHKMPALNESGIKLSINKGEDSLEFRTAVFSVNESNGRIIRSKLNVAEISNFNPDFFEPDTEVYIVAKQGSNERLLFSHKSDFKGSEKWLTLDEQANENIHFVGTQGFSDDGAALLWDSINLTDLDQIVIDSLKLVEPKIIGLTFVGNENLGALGNVSNNFFRVPLVRLEDQEERIPLKSLGDGVTRVLHIILSLVNAKNGVLLIDEFENGLHWVVQQSVWEVIFQLAETLNVQVFCTTHSRDCISSFGEVWKKQPNAGAFFRLYNRNGTVQAKEYDVETLSDSLETDVEVR